MNKFSITMMSLVAMTGMAVAQQKAPAGAGSAAPAAKTPAPAAKAPAPAAGAPAAKADAKAPVAPPAPMTPPKPPAEIAAAAKAMGKPTKACTGSGMGPDMQMADFKGTVTTKPDLDGWFLRTTINVTIGKGKTASKMKMEQLSTFDTKAAKWRVVGASNDGATMTGWADMKDGKYEFVGEMTSGMGTAQFKDHGDMTDPKSAKWWGEMSMDKGKTWTKVYEQTCK